MHYRTSLAYLQPLGIQSFASMQIKHSKLPLSDTLKQLQHESVCSHVYTPLKGASAVFRQSENLLQLFLQKKSFIYLILYIFISALLAACQTEETCWSRQLTGCRRRRTPDCRQIVEVPTESGTSLRRGCRSVFHRTTSSAQVTLCYRNKRLWTGGTSSERDSDGSAVAVVPFPRLLRFAIKINK